MSVIPRAIYLSLIFIVADLMANEQVQAEDLLLSDDIEVVTIEAERSQSSQPEIDTIKTIAGAGNDILKAIEILPGVTLTGDGFGGEPVIRGSSPVDNQYFVNGVRIGYVFHNDGDSIFNAGLVQSFRLETGAWKPALGNAIGGIISLELNPGEALYRIRQSSQFTQLDLSLRRSGLLYANQISDDQRLYISYRESLLFLYFDALTDDDEQEEEGIEFTQVPRNRDYQLSYQWDIDDEMTFEFFVSGAKDFIAIDLNEDNDEVKKNPDLLGGIDVRQAYNNQALMLYIDNDDYFAHWRLNALQQDIVLEVGQALDLDGVVYNNALTVDYEWPLNDSFILLAGAEILEERFDYTATGRDQPCNDEFQICPPSFIAPIVSSKGVVKTQMPSAFTDLNWLVNDYFELSIGIRADYNSYSGQSFYEPRVSLRSFINEKQSLWFKYGQHHQWFRGFEYGYIVEGFGTDDLEVVEADHYVLGFSSASESELIGNYFWQIEAYYKDLSNLVVANPDAQTETNSLANDIEPYVNGATGEAYGFEFLLRKDFTDNWQAWLTVAYSETTRFNEITDESFNFQYDQPWIINLAASYQLTSRLTLSAKWRYQSGNTYTDIIGATPIDDGNGGILAYDPIEGEINAERFSATHRLDLRADFLLSDGNPDLGWRKPQIIAYIELLNAYGQKNQNAWDYEEDYSDREAEYNFPEMVLPSLGITFTF